MIEPARATFLLIDMQNGFIDGASPLCIAGAAAHNTGQILAAMAVLGSRAPLVYLPPLLLCSLVTGAVTGGASMLLVHRIPLPGDIKS